MTVLQDGEIVLFGFVGDTFFEEGFTARDVLDALMEVGRDTDITVRLNSGGGLVVEGIAIFNAFKAHAGKVSIVVDAIAASAASLIAMSGDTITMRAGSLMMIHEVSNFAMGTADDLLHAAETTEKVSALTAEIYAERSANSVEDVRSDMKATTWMTGEEAVNKGYADEAVSLRAVAATAFDYRALDKAPQRLVALAQEKNWSFEAKPDATPPVVAPRQDKETSTMTVPPTETPTPANPATAAAAAGGTETKTPVAPSAPESSSTVATAQDANDRMTAIMASDKIKGKEKAAMDLALKSPDMTADAVIDFVAENISGESASSGDDYLSRKAKANGTLGLGGPGTGPAPENTSGNWSAAMKRAGVSKKS